MLALDKYTSDIHRLCATHKVRHLYVFGSALTDRYNAESDIDFVVDFEPIDLSLYADNYYDLKFSLQDILHKPIDLLEQQAIRNPLLRESIDQQKKLIYCN
jgi:predicted nucleotidyltransferase